MLYYAATRKDEVTKFDYTLMDLESILFSEIDQREEKAQNHLTY